MAQSQPHVAAASSKTPDTTQHRFTDADIGRTALAPTYRVELRPTHTPDVFYDADPVGDWGALSWMQIGRPYRVERWSAEKRRWEREHDQALPVKTSWELFNRSFQQMFDTPALAARRAAAAQLAGSALTLDLLGAWDAVEEMVQATLWNHIQRVDDMIWDPRGKRALFEGLDVKKPEILFLGAADGYEAMQLLAMHPGGHAVLVDYDDYCRTDRFGQFPEAYPFLGVNPSTGGSKVSPTPRLKPGACPQRSDTRHVRASGRGDLMNTDLFPPVRRQPDLRGGIAPEAQAQAVSLTGCQGASGAASAYHKTGDRLHPHG
jgi:hypothetical protein